VVRSIDMQVGRDRGFAPYGWGRYAGRVGVNMLGGWGRYAGWNRTDMLCGIRNLGPEL
jgi:hypothetical protein